MKNRTGSPVILNVDDDEAGRYVVDRHLRKAGYEVLDAATGQDGLRLAESLQPDLILLDVRLPDIDGFEVCRRIKQNPNTASILILQMSASYRDISSQVKGLENGADGYLTEPIEPAFLTATINSLLRMKKAEQSVKLAERQWQNTFNAVKEGIVYLDRSGNIVRANTAYYSILQTKSQQVQEVIQTLLTKAYATKERLVAEEAIGEQVLSITIDHLPGDTLEDSGAVCTIADITQRKTFESQLLQTQKLEAIGVLAGGIAHDFNNLLTGILGNASLLLDMLPPGGMPHGLASEIVKNGESAALLTSQILAYSGKGKFISRPLDMSDAVLADLPFLRRFVPKRVGLICNTDPGPLVIMGDPGQIKQVLMNLIINAAEAFPANAPGTITVETSRKNLDKTFFRGDETGLQPGLYVVLVIADNGTGMDAATQSRIFEPFFTTKFLGRGLGLSAVHGIIAGHKGILRLTSALGQGTRFEVYFPAYTDETTGPTGRPVDEKVRGGSGTILVVDDEASIRNFATFALERYGYTVLTAANGLAGVELFESRREEIGLVVLDLSMPVMGGEEALDRIRAVSVDVPVVLSSGFTQEIANERFKGKALSSFLAKPYNASQIVTLAGRFIIRPN